MLFPFRRRAIWPFVVITIFLILLLRGTFSSSSSDSYLTEAPPADEVNQMPIPARPDRSAAVKFLSSVKMRTLWDELRAALTAGDIGVQKLELSDDGFSGDYVDPNSDFKGERQRENHIAITAAQIESMRRHLSQFKGAIPRLAAVTPYWKNTRGIVMGGGGKYTHIALTSLLLLRRTGCKLPVQVFIDSHEEYDAELCEQTFARLNAECLVMEDLIGKGAVSQYQYKILSILFSPFQHVLFLDADAWPIYDPTYLFEQEPYTSHGLITWPDFWVSTASWLFFDITGTRNGPVMERRSSESGIIMYNKATHIQSILLAAYYNWYGPDIYYKLLTQGSHGEGDKETFLHAALGMGQPFYDVKEKNGIFGRWINDTLHTAGMIQHDPVDDLKLQRHREAHDGEPKKDKDDKVVPAKPLFIHHNLWKMDFFDLGDDISPIHLRDKDGKLTRTWGDQKDMYKRVGFDVEEMMFRTLIDAKCKVVEPPSECPGLRNYYQTVFRSGSR
jgi:alpha 1,2-mannosyltransferase